RLGKRGRAKAADLANEARLDVRGAGDHVDVVLFIADRRLGRDEHRADRPAAVSRDLASSAQDVGEHVAAERHREDLGAHHRERHGVGLVSRKVAEPTAWSSGRYVEHCASIRMANQDPRLSTASVPWPAPRTTSSTTVSPPIGLWMAYVVVISDERVSHSAVVR